ncbi:hypothetical protein Mapa_004686 [Marchantia paleacea]|nr:hypothetical protein Mapa_004686 [Marchantia paleacea]
MPSSNVNKSERFSDWDVSPPSKNAAPFSSKSAPIRSYNAALFLPPLKPILPASSYPPRLPIISNLFSAAAEAPSTIITEKARSKAFTIVQVPFPRNSFLKSSSSFGRRLAPTDDRIPQIKRSNRPFCSQTTTTARASAFEHVQGDDALHHAICKNMLRFCNCHAAKASIVATESSNAVPAATQRRQFGIVKSNTRCPKTSIESDALLHKPDKPALCARPESAAGGFDGRFKERKREPPYDHRIPLIHRSAVRMF